MNWSHIRNTGLGLSAALALISFLFPLQAGVLSLACIFGVGFFISFVSAFRKEKTEQPRLGTVVRQVVYTVLIPSLLLQAAFFLDRGAYYGFWLVLLLVLINVAIVVGVSLAGVLMPWLWRNRSRLPELRLRLTGGAVLGMFVLQLLCSTVVLPGAVLAAESGTGAGVSSDQFIEDYDPEQEVVVEGKTEMPETPPHPISKGKPKEGKELEEFIAYCESEGFAAGITECFELIEGYGENPEGGSGGNGGIGGMFEEGEMFIPIIYEEVQQIVNPKEKNTGKNAGKNGKNENKKKAKGKNSNVIKQAAQKKDFWYHAKEFGKGIWGTGASVVSGTVDAVKWMVKNPKKVLKGLATVAKYANPIGLMVGTYQASKWVYQNRAKIVATAKTLKKQADTYGWHNVAGAVLFSKDAVDAWKKGEYGYALGRGMSEFALNVLSLIPPAAALKVPLIGKGLATGIKGINAIDDVLSGVKAAELGFKGAAVVFKTTPKVLGFAQTAGSTLGKAVMNSNVLKVTETAYNTGVKRELKAMEQAINASTGVGAKQAVGTVGTGAKQAVVELPAPIEKIMNRAADMAAQEKSVAKTSETIADLYKRGGSFDNSMKVLADNSSTVGKTADTVTDTTKAISKNPGVQKLVDDVADPVVAKTITEGIVGTGGTVNKPLKALGDAVAKTGDDVLAVGSTGGKHADAVLVVDRRSGKGSVVSVADDGTAVVKPLGTGDISGKTGRANTGAKGMQDTGGNGIPDTGKKEIPDTGTGAKPLSEGNDVGKKGTGSTKPVDEVSNGGKNGSGKSPIANNPGGPKKPDSSAGNGTSGGNKTGTGTSGNAGGSGTSAGKSSGSPVNPTQQSIREGLGDMADDIDRAEAAADAEIQAIFNSSQQFAVKGDGTVKVGAKSNGGMKAAGGGGTSAAARSRLGTSPSGNSSNNYGSTTVSRDIETELAKGGLPLDPVRPLTPDELGFNEYVNNGHGSSRHSGRSKTYIKLRAVSENKRYTSTYFSKNQFTEAVNMALKNKAPDIEAWLLSNDTRPKAFSVTKLDGDFGWVYDNIARKYYKNKVARVVFKKNGNGGFFLLTNYVKE